MGESLKVSLGYSDHGSELPLWPEIFQCFSKKKKTKKTIFFKYTNEMPGELSHKNMISSHVKITCYLHMCTKITVAMEKKNAPFEAKNLTVEPRYKENLCSILQITQFLPVFPDPFYVLITFMVITHVVQINFIFLSAKTNIRKFSVFYHVPVFFSKLNAFICDAPFLIFVPIQS